MYGGMRHLSKQTIINSRGGGGRRLDTGSIQCDPGTDVIDISVIITPLSGNTNTDLENMLLNIYK